MNKEILKAINDKQKKHPIRNWWRKNGYKVLRVVLFPAWWYVVIKEKVSNYRYKHTVWDEERANKILEYYVPKYAKWDKEEKIFYFFDNGLGWNYKKYIKRKDRKFWEKFSYKIRDYLIEKFELEGFEKQIIDNGYSSWIEIVFKYKGE